MFHLVPSSPSSGSGSMSDYEDAIDSMEEDGDGEASEESPLNSIGATSLQHGVRQRRPFLWDDSISISSELPGLREVQEILEWDIHDLTDEEDCTGCPLPSTPIDPMMFESEVTEVLKVGIKDMDLGALMSCAREPAEDFVRRVWEASWSVCSFCNLPDWLQDNDYLHHGHRPPLPSFYACFRSIFRIHTETGNIWTHLLGCVAFIGVLTAFMLRPSEELPLPDKIVFGTYFLGAIICLGFSFAFHTVYCHSEFVGKLFSKLDYCGIAVLITGSFVPWLYYGFYCHVKPRIIYMTVVIVLGIACMVVSLWDRFSDSKFRPLRAGVFATFGLSGVIPAVHYAIAEGWLNAIYNASLGWLILMGCLYILGALVYAFRVPECLFPGKFDIWFQSHQIFHTLVLAAAFVHYHGITEMATYRMSIGGCTAQTAAIVF